MAQNFHSQGQFFKSEGIYGVSAMLCFHAGFWIYKNKQLLKDLYINTGANNAKNQIGKIMKLLYLASVSFQGEFVYEFNHSSSFLGNYNV